MVPNRTTHHISTKNYIRQQADSRKMFSIKLLHMSERLQTKAQEQIFNILDRVTFRLRHTDFGYSNLVELKSCH